MKKFAILFIIGLLVMVTTFSLYGCAKKAVTPSKVSSAPMLQFNALYISVGHYLASGKPLKNIYPLKLEKEGYLSKTYGGYPYKKPNYNWTSLGGWAGEWPLPNKQYGVGIGIVGSYKNIQPIIKKYRSKAIQIFFPYPQILKLKIKKNQNEKGQLIMIFPTKGFRH